jgi:DNA-binding CsgD family transcriptional regulator
MAGMTLDSDLQRVLEVESAIAKSQPGIVGLADAVLQHLSLLIPCEVVSFVDFDVALGITYVDQACIDGLVTTRTGQAPTVDDPFFRYYWSAPMCSYPSRTGDARSVIMRTDFASDRQWRNSPMYLDNFHAAGLDHSMLCCLSNGRTRTQRVIFFRSGRSFSERERMFLALLRPHLAEALPAGTAPRRTPLTARQHELLRLVAAGLTNTEVATQLCLSPNTVRKHLENIYERLQVTTRTAAVALAFPEGR